MKQLFYKLMILGFVGISTMGLASATTITYDTTASFFAPGTGVAANGQSITFLDGIGGSGTLFYFQPASGTTTVTVPPTTNISYGYFQLTYTGSGTLTIPALTFNLVINDTLDALPPVTIVGKSTAATATATNSTLTFTFAPLLVNEGNVLLTITSPTQVPPTSNFQGQASIQGTASSAAPEPATLSMLGIGLAGIGFAARRRVKK